MLESRPTPKPGENTWLWLLKITSGVFIFALLVIHLIVNHFVAPEGLLTYADVVRYFQNPAVLVMEATFLVLVVVHSLVGLRGVLLDLRPGSTALRWLDRSLLLLGAVAILYGLWLLLTVASQSPA